VKPDCQFVREVTFALCALFAPILAFAQDVAPGTLLDLPTPAGVNVRRDLPYDTHPRQQLDLYLPIGRLAQPRPVIVFIHGGSWRTGSKADGRRLAWRFVAQGYAVACIDYRFSSDAGFPAQLEDCKSAVRWLRGNAERYALDREHIGVLGVSAGGHLAALLGAMNSSSLYESGGSLDQHSRVQGVVDFFGPVDLLQLFDDARKSQDPLAGEIALLLGGDPHRVPVPTTASNPTLFIDAATPPFLIIHGAQDPSVPPTQSRLLYDALVKSKITAHLHLIHGAAHFGPAFVAPNINAMVDAFFARMLKEDPQSPELKSADVTESTAAK
jgi:acetyl esterase/lipase